MMRNARQFDFSKTPAVNVPRSSFNRSFTHNTTLNAGYLVPVFAKMVLPGDSVQLGAEFFARELTLLYPSMDTARLEMFAFYCPLRILQANFVKNMGERLDPDDSVDYPSPIMDKTQAPLSTTGYLEHSLADYFGHPTKVTAVTHTVWKYRMYNRVYNDWFRRQDLTDSVPMHVGDGPDNPADYVLLKSSKRPDYFTSCVTQPQKGDAVMLPFTGSAPVVGIDGDITMHTSAQSTPRTLATAINDAALGNGVMQLSSYGGVSASALRWDNTQLEADLDDAIQITINDLRLSAQVQKVLERDQQAGSRFNEGIFAHFGVVVPDYRVQRSEFLGQWSTPLNHHVVAQTSKTDGSAYQGTLSAFGTVLGEGGFRKSFVEHGIVMIICRIRADVSYQQGLEREDTYRTRFDYPLPLLSHLGEQPVYCREIFCQGDSVVDGQGNIVDNKVFGYIPRFDERRWANNIKTGYFRSNATGSLDSWHYSEEFASLPPLNDEFMEDQSDVVIGRTIAVQNQPQFKLMIAFKFNHIQAFPTYATPGIHIL